MADSNPVSKGNRSTESYGICKHKIKNIYKILNGKKMWLWPVVYSQLSSAAHWRWWAWWVVGMGVIIQTIHVPPGDG
jgi:hypothetical protein